MVMDTTVSAPGSSRRRVVAAFAAVYLIWGSTYLAIRIGVETLPPFLMAGLRFLTAGFILYAWERRRGAPRPQPVHWRTAVVQGFLLFLGGNGLVTWAERRIPSGTAALLVATVPLWMALLPVIASRENRPGAAVWAGLFMGFAGVGILAAPALGTGNMLCVAAVVFGALCWAAGSLYSRKAPMPSSLLMSTALQMLCGGAILFSVGAAAGELRGFAWSAVSGRSVAALAYLVTFGALGGFTCYAWLLQAVSPVAVSSYAYVNPLVAVFLGWAVAGEAVGVRTLLATVAIVAAVVLMSFSPRPAPRPAAPREAR
jgi:drug/metabolite transporter (DMT)-like permease